MPPSHPRGERRDAVTTAVHRVAVDAGSSIHAARIGRRWTLRQLADAASMSPSAVQRIESGATASIESYASLGTALGLRVEVSFVDARSRPAGKVQADIVHAAMGELEVRRFAAFDFGTGVDEPYQHYQFAGRADVLAWSVDARALLHIENRTRFPNVQEAAGAWNSKREYLPRQLAERLGVGRWQSVTHVMVGLWTREVLDAVRTHQSTFQSLCPDDPAAFDEWWHGRTPQPGVTASFVLLDPVASRRRQIGQLAEGLTSRPRHHGYAEVALRLQSK